MSVLRVILHAPTAGSLARARSNARNLLLAEPDAQVEIVVNAQAVRCAIEAPDADTDALLRFCENTLQRQNLQPPPHAATIQAAVVYMAARQAEGWAYIRC